MQNSKKQQQSQQIGTEEEDTKYFSRYYCYSLKDGEKIINSMKQKYGQKAVTEEQDIFAEQLSESGNSSQNNFAEQESNSQNQKLTEEILSNIEVQELSNIKNFELLTTKKNIIKLIQSLMINIIGFF